MASLPVSMYSREPAVRLVDIQGISCTISYSVLDKKILGIIPRGTTAQVEVRLGSGDAKLSFAYALPSDEKQSALAEKGIEDGIYALIHQTVSLVRQEKRLEKADEYAKRLENQNIYHDSLEASLDGFDGETDVSGDVQILIPTFMSLTKIPSLSGQGYHEHLQRTEAHPDVPDPSPVSSHRQSLDAILDAIKLSIDAHDCPAKEHEKRASRYLKAITDDNETVPLRKEHVDILLKEFVPAYIAARKNGSFVPELRRNPVGYTIHAFFNGGIAGWFTLSLIGESVINHIAGTQYDIPGFYIGAAAAFTWPILRDAYRAVGGGAGTEKRRSDLVFATKQRLYTVPPLRRKQNVRVLAKAKDSDGEELPAASAEKKGVLHRRRKNG